MNVDGTVRVPGDKSITHRALIFGALACGTTYLDGALTSLDARASARVLRQLGAEVSALRPGQAVRIAGRGRFRKPSGPLDCRNSGTTARLLLGALAAHPFPARVTGDASLRRRPMRRVTGPLAGMGARFEDPGGDGLPLRIHGGPLRPLDYDLPVSSAQIKSCLLLAGVCGRVTVRLREPHGRSRDHTERMLQSFGYTVFQDGGLVDFAPDGKIEPFDLQVPGDPSSAAFLVGAALLASGGELRVSDVGLNPTRTGFLEVLERMAARVEVDNRRTESCEPAGDLIAGPAELRGTTVPEHEIPGLIDEIPLLAVLASRARGTSRFERVGELRVKESNRLELIARNLRAVGAGAEVQGEDLVVGRGSS
ncbi:MAG: 3-phosphoshikimate 1-carboxyvinyltransferase, partial [Gemmatimonadales bacterium]